MSFLKIGIGLIAFAIFMWASPWLDDFISLFFYKEGFHNNAWHQFVYKWAVWPATITAACGLICFIGSFLSPYFKKYRRLGLVLFLTLAIGSGLITHLLLKDQWGRPRPRQTLAFGGDQEFRPFYKPYFNNPHTAKSFPCGHCASGFYFFVLAFIGKKTSNRRLETSGWILGSTLGVILSLTRIAQGGHWFSDTVISALIMLTTAWLITSLCMDNTESKIVLKDADENTHT